jgi:transforming growth factor-beta-induced protein
MIIMKTLNRKFQYFLIAIAMVGVLASCNKDEDEPMTESKNIVETASSDPQFSILVSALQKADLVTALQGVGPFTVFAPTNEAFNTLFSQLGVSGIDDLSAETLTPILLNHVVSGNIKSTDITTGYAMTLNNTAPGQNSVKVFIEKTSGVKVDGSQVTTADVMATNGVIHVIDKVIIPASVVNHAINNPNFSILVEAVVKAGLVDALSAAGPFTVFAPTNDAFSKLFNTLGVTGIADLTAEQLTPILLYHVVAGNVRASQVSTGNVPTLKEGSDISIMASEMGVKLNDSSNVIATDVQGSNGVIHVIDTVILP